MSDREFTEIVKDMNVFLCLEKVYNCAEKDQTEIAVLDFLYASDACTLHDRVVPE